MPLATLRQVTKEYSSPAGSLRALDSVDLTVNSGDFLAVVGRSGCGKSTLLNMLAGLDRPTSGAVEVDGTDLATLDEDQLAAWRGRAVGVVFQSFQLLPTLTVLENVALPMDLCGTTPRTARAERSMQLLARVGVEDQALKFPAMLSGGQQQRVAIARALANEPRLVVADEPTGNLDRATSRSMLELFASLTAESTTVVIVTHEREVDEFATQIVTLEDGRRVDAAADLAKATQQ